MADPSTVDYSQIQVCGASDAPGQHKGLVAETGQLWPNGSTITVSISGDKASDFVKGKIMQFANVWSQYANLKFQQVGSGGQIRVLCTTSGGSWSYIGTGAKNIASDKETMHYGWLTDKTDDTEFSRVVTHEFGHAIGFDHEQASPAGNIPWNKPVVYKYYKDSQGWDAGQVDSQVFAKLSAQGRQYTAYDRTSIMEYSYPKEFTTDGSSAPTNTQLDDLDKQFAMKLYPKSGGGGTGPVRSSQDGVYLVNCFKGDERASGVAYYSDLKNGGNDGQQPNDYVDVNKGSLYKWEQNGSITFPKGTKVSWSIDSGAQGYGVNAHAGAANNGHENWNVYKDKYRKLYERDGWQCYTVYWCY